VIIAGVRLYLAECKRERMSTSRASGTVSANELEVAHFMGEGDGSAAIQHVFDEFENRHPGVDIVPTGYTNTSSYGLEIKSRILRENPPSVFMTWTGKDLVPYLESDAIADLTDLWESDGLTRAYVDGVADLVAFEGRYAAVPLDIHRKNNLFYNVQLAEAVGVDPGRIDDPRELLEVLRQCEDESFVGMTQPMKNPWTVLQLWAQIVVGLYGTDVYEAISAGNGRAHRSEIQESLSLLAAYAELADEDAYFLGMVGADGRFRDGESLFFQQGDWVGAGYRELDGFDYRTDWDHVPFPGTDGVYVMGMDAITAAADTPHSEAADEFLSVAASRPALEGLNRHKGSIPPRSDVSLDSYPPFLQDQYQDFKTARAHTGGQKALVPPDGSVETRDVFVDFVDTRDVEATTKELVACYDH
jgi:glucose/mannose transport system substrate-binding protein